jgi:hypothetical protein
MNDHEVTLTLYAPKDKRAADWWNSLGDAERLHVLVYLSKNPPPPDRERQGWTQIDWAYTEMILGNL